jgi:hypothetical protein
MLKLEILAAGQGDGILLHHGTDAAPLRMLIDGGAGGTWKRALQPRLKALGAGAPGAAINLVNRLALELIMVSHLDDDHINGILAMLRNEVSLDDDQQPMTIRAGSLWVNVFDELAAADAADAGTAAAASDLGSGIALGAQAESQAVIASIPQGRDLRDVARRLDIPLNAPFKSGLVLAGQAPDPVPFGDITLQVLGPSQARLDDLRKKWNAYLKAHKAKDEKAIAKSAAFVDKSVFNLSSIVALVRQGARTILLTGDARGDDILDGLDEAGLLHNGKIHLDCLKVPHHGSANNATEGFFRSVTASNYVICSDGTDDNPDDEMLQMLQTARSGATYHIWFSYRQPRLEAFVTAAQNAGEALTATFRDDNQPSLEADLD